MMKLLIVLPTFLVFLCSALFSLNLCLLDQLSYCSVYHMHLKD
jgi:hypothetical protein